MVANSKTESARRISSGRPAFVPSILINKKMESMMVHVAHDLAERVVYELSELYFFNADEALELLDLGSMVVNREENAKKVVKEKVVKEKRIPLPFSGVCDDSKCQGICLNYGLYTQCPSEKSESDLCVSCASTNAFGRMEDRLKEGFKTPEGKSPVHFITVMRKLRLTREEVESEALKQGVDVSEDHFKIPEKSKKEKKVSTEVVKKGRPQKAKKVLELETSDIFSAMVSAASEEEEEEDMSSLSSNSVSSNESEKKSSKKSSKKSVLSEEKLLLKEQNAAEKAAKEAAKELAKQQKEEEKAAKELAKQQKEEEKAAKELAKQQKEEEKAAKELAKQQKEEEKAAKELAKQQKEEDKSQKSGKKSTKTAKVEVVAEIGFKVAPTEPLKCVIINGKGQTKKSGLQESDKKFLKTSLGDILDFDSRAVIGVWNKDESRIVFNDDYVESEEEAEEEEDEYDEE